MIDEKIIVNTIEWIADNIYMVAFYVLILLTLQWLFVVVWIWIDAKRRYTKLWMIIFMTMIGMVPLIGLFLYLILRNKYSLDERYYIDLEKKALFSESLSVMECYKCKHINENENSFCTYCGAQLRKDCPKCKNSVTYFSLFCSQCGNSFRKDLNNGLIEDVKNVTTENKQPDSKIHENTSQPDKATIKVKKVKNTSKNNTSRFKLKALAGNIKTISNRFFNNLNNKLSNLFSASKKKEPQSSESSDKK